MQRISAMWKMGPGKAVAALAVLALAAAVFVGSGASYTTGTASPGNQIVAGHLTGLSASSFAIDEQNLQPGDDRGGLLSSTPNTVSIDNVGNAAGRFYLDRPSAQVVDQAGDVSPAAGGLNIAGGADIVLTHPGQNLSAAGAASQCESASSCDSPTPGTCPGGTYPCFRSGGRWLDYKGKLADWPTNGVNLGDFTPGMSTTYNVEVAWPTTDSGAANRSGSQTTWVFQWNAINTA